MHLLRRNPSHGCVVAGCGWPLCRQPKPRPDHELAWDADSIPLQRSDRCRYRADYADEHCCCPARTAGRRRSSTVHRRGAAGFSRYDGSRHSSAEAVLELKMPGRWMLCGWRHCVQVALRSLSPMVQNRAGQVTRRACGRRGRVPRRQSVPAATAGFLGAARGHGRLRGCRPEAMAEESPWLRARQAPGCATAGAGLAGSAAAGEGWRRAGGVLPHRPCRRCAPGRRAGGDASAALSILPIRDAAHSTRRRSFYI